MAGGACSLCLAAARADLGLVAFLGARVTTHAHNLAALGHRCGVLLIVATHRLRLIPAHAPLHDNAGCNTAVLVAALRVLSRYVLNTICVEDGERERGGSYGVSILARTWG
jgi:hypothetical protein